MAKCRLMSWVALDDNGCLLLWGTGQLEQEYQKIGQESQRAEQEHRQVERLTTYLWAQGLDSGQTYENIFEYLSAPVDIWEQLQANRLIVLGT